MKNYLLSIRRIVFGFFLLFIVFFVRGQGSETITNPITGSPTSSYISRTWTGDNGQIWSSTDSRSDQTVYGNVTSSGTMNSTPKTASPVSGIATFNNIVHTAIGSNLTLNATSGSLASATSSTFNIILQSSASDYFRSKGTGNWGAVGSWESSSDTSNWIDATSAPTSSATSITIRNGHTITVGTSATSKNLTVDSGGFLTVSSLFTLSGTTNINGTWNQTTTSTITNEGTLNFNANSNYNNTANNGTIPTATWNATSNCNITGYTNSGAISSISGIGQAFGNLTFNNSGSSNFINLFSSGGSITVAGTLTVGPSSNNNVSFSNSTGTITANINKIIVSGGYLNGVGALAIVNLTVNTDLVVSGNGIFRQSSGTGTANVTVNNDVVINDNGVIQLVGGTNSNVVAQTLNVQRDFIINGVVAQLRMKPNSASSAVPTVNVGRNFSSNNTDASAVDVDFGAGTVTNSAINITGNLTHTGNGVYQTSSSSQAKGFVFRGSSSSPSQISYSGTNSDNTRYVVDAGSFASLTSNLTLGSSTGPASYFTVNGNLNFNDKSIIGNTVARFITAAGATLATSNVDGLGGTAASGSLMSFGSTNTTSTNGTAQFIAGINYIFNGSTTTPFPTGTFGNPASLTFNNADVTSNRTATLTVTGAVNINGTSKFALNSVAGNNLFLGGVLTVDTNASFDSNGENQITNNGGSVVVNGTFITKDAQGFSGTNATIPTITDITLNNGSTVQYALDGAQAISSRTDYKNLLFTGNGTKSSNNRITPIAGTVTVNGANTILDVSNNTFGNSSTNLTMTAGTFRLGGSGVKPDISGTYSLSAGTTIEFTGTSATQIRLAPQYANVVISGTNVVAGTTTNGGLTFRAGGNFTVKTGARFKVNNDNGFSGDTTTAIKNTNSPVITLETGSTIDYMGSDQIITNALPYQNLTVSTLGTKTSASGDLIVNNLTTVSAGTLKFLKTADNATPNVLYAHKGINNVGGSVIFENNAQLMQDDDANNTQATIQSQRDVVDMNNISTQMDYVYWSSPVDGQNIKAFSPNTPANGYLQYNESNDKFSVTTDANFQNGKGYAIRAETGTNGYNKSYVFTGIPHNSSLGSPNLRWTDANHGYNLVGNPYPSNINFDALFANNSSKIYSTAWFWTNNSYTAAQLGSSYNGNNYAVYNGTGGSPATYNPASPYTGSAIPNGIVKVGQAFIVQAKSGGLNQPIGFTNTMRTTSGGNFFQKQGAKNRFWLTMTSPNTLVNTILVGYITGASNDFETDFDGELFVVGSDSFYSLLGAKKLAIQGKADVFSADDVVSIGNVYSTDGSYSINLQDAEGLFDGSQKIYLRDKLLNKYIDMTSDHSYQFTAVKGTDNTRFEIVYKDKSVLGSDSAVKSNFIVYKDGNEQVVKSDKKLGRIELFDASGKLIRSYVATSNEFRIDTSTLMNALYIIKINNSGEIRTKKFIK
ncbi:T9SS type A sorting domain-containing protein [Epilithonimonas hominis]|uniref:T9SS type A sorting domain-containing protein n=1 Tax=Epilithonimonas hominis TaxID=420404 RepID=UPI0028A0F663|nr:T9SS type A sorting domain-containing protein [Epilithonimonas hominis]